jgi:acyl carrier protein
MPLIDQVCAIVADVIDDDGVKVGPSDSQETIKGWDSLASVHILTATSQEFDLNISVEHFGEFHSVQSIAALVEKLRAGA